MRMRKVFIILATILTSICGTQAEDLVSIASITFSSAPQGVINANAVFTVSTSGQKVYFSQGNLQYQPSTKTWRFAEHQYDFIPANEPANNATKTTQTTWMDLFPWGANNLATNNKSYDPAEFPAYLNSSTMCCGKFDLEQTNYDWGMNKIQNGGKSGAIWRCMTKEEWNYLLTKHQLIYSKLSIDGRTFYGLIIVPDVYKGSVELPSKPQEEQDQFVTYSQEQWNALEAAGCVFLPCNGFVTPCETTISNVANHAYYWSSTGYENQRSSNPASGFYAEAYRTYISCRFGNLKNSQSFGLRGYRYSVRLVSNYVE